MTQKHTNHLIHETSPYLLQHAHNPVDWHPWNEAALQKAKTENKPILVSIGYSSCHWCHVMEHESFENEEIAKIQNQHFVNIKIDREERPDLDEIYMNAVQLLTGRGGWPLNVFLTPDLKPFFGGTYFPPQPRYNVISWPDLLVRVAEYYQTQKEQLLQSQENLFGYIKNLSQAGQSADDLKAAPIDLCVSQLKQTFDKAYGGFGMPPKFPHPLDMQLLLRYSQRTGDQSALDMALFTLEKMAKGGMYDQLGGGFHRYSTDEKWLVPHFEKMLYDNALLLKAYVDAFVLTKNEFFKSVIEGIVGYIQNEMTDPQGAFFAAQDADSEGVEGEFFVWSVEEVESVLDKDQAQVFIKHFGMTKEGNFEGKNILFISDSAHPADDKIIVEAKNKLLAVRKKRIAPDTDRKIITSWNGLMIGALARAGFYLNRPEWIGMAEKAKDFIKSHLFKDQELYRIHKDGQSKIAGFLEDYAYFTEGLLELFEATGNPETLQLAIQLQDLTDQYFADKQGAGYFFTKETQSDVITRSRASYDSATPSAQSITVMNLLRLSSILAEDRYREQARKTLSIYYNLMEQQPRAFVQMVTDLDFYLQEVKEIVLFAKKNDSKAEEFLNVMRDKYLPYKTFALLKEEGKSLWQKIPVFQDQLDSKETTVFICRQHVCDKPITQVEELTFK